jgi:FO synthase
VGPDADGGKRVTYSRKVFVPLTHLCRDACGYCTFAWPPKGDLPAFLSPDEVVDIARAGQAAGCKEALFTLGDRPEARYPAAAAWLEARGYATTLEYLRAVAIQVIEATGLLPHLNPGVMSWAELATLKQVSASMGMMLESTSTRLLEKGQAHFNAPDKVPAVRLRTLEDAGRLSVPFTSGLLVGIGESPVERADTLFALRDVHRRYGHLQEVIVQNFRAKPDTAMRAHIRSRGSRRCWRRWRRRGWCSVRRCTCRRRRTSRPTPTGTCCGPGSTTSVGCRRSPPTTSTRRRRGRSSTRWRRGRRSTGSR